MNEWLTIKEVVGIARMSSSAVMKHVKNGNIKATKPARKILIHKDDLAAFMERGRILPKQSA